MITRNDMRQGYCAKLINGRWEHRVALKFQRSAISNDKEPTDVVINRLIESMWSDIYGEFLPPLRELLNAAMLGTQDFENKKTIVEAYDRLNNMLKG